MNTEQRYPAAEMERMMKLQDVLLKAMAKKITSWEAAEIIGVSDRTTVNNVKVLGWNGNTDGIEMSANTSVSNVFVRSGDDSLKMWGHSDTIKNATVWQDFNGGVVNLGWYKTSPGHGGLVDGLYVVKTDWLMPAVPGWNWTGLNDQNNGFFVSQMVPGTNFGAHAATGFPDYLHRRPAAAALQSEDPSSQVQ